MLEFEKMLIFKRHLDKEERRTIGDYLEDFVGNQHMTHRIISLFSLKLESLNLLYISQYSSYPTDKPGLAR